MNVFTVSLHSGRSASLMAPECFWEVPLKKVPPSFIQDEMR
jgi:hypothetical protein